MNRAVQNKRDQYKRWVREQARAERNRTFYPADTARIRALIDSVRRDINRVGRDE